MYLVKIMISQLRKKQQTTIPLIKEEDDREEGLISMTTPLKLRNVFNGGEASLLDDTSDAFTLNYIFHQPFHNVTTHNTVSLTKSHSFPVLNEGEL